MSNRRAINSIVVCLIFSLAVSLPQATAQPEKVKVTDIKVGSGKAYELGDSLEIGNTKYYIDRDYVVTAMPEELEGMWEGDSNSSAGFKGHLTSRPRRTIFGNLQRTWPN